jgi:hypothetical protein
MPLITTTLGDMEADLLEKRNGSVDNDNEFTTWTEYWLDGQLVHRSAHVQLKQPVALAVEAASFS